MRSSASASGLQERWHGRLVADSPQRLGGGAAVLSRRRSRAARSVGAPPLGRARGPSTWIAACRTVSSGSRRKSWTIDLRGGMVDPRERPDDVAAQAWRGVHWSATSRKRVRSAPFARGDGRGIRSPCRCTAGRGIAEQRRRRPRSHGSTEIVEPLPEFVPHGSSTFGAPCALDAIDRAQHVRLLELRGRAAELVPAAGIDDDQAAVGVLEHVGRVEVEVGAGDEVFVLGREAWLPAASGRAG